MSPVLSTPLARAVAAKKNIDINSVKGSGFNGRVLVADIENWAGVPAPKAAPQASAMPKSAAPSVTYTPRVSFDERRIKPTPLRKAVAKAMANSWAHVSYTNLVMEADLTMLWKQRELLKSKEWTDKLGVKLTFMPFIIKAVSLALQEFPNINAKYLAETEELVQYGYTNIGMAVDTPHGLFVPVIKNVERKNLIEIAAEVAVLATKARDKQLALADMSGGTFSITNYGTVGALHGVPVINYPELGILGVGAIVDRAVVNELGQVSAGKIMHLTGAVDHKWIDGAEIGRFLWKVKTILENPILLLGEFNV